MNCEVYLVQLYGPLQPPNAEPLGLELIAAAVRAEYRECSVHVSLLADGDVGGFQTLTADLRDSLVQVVGLAVPQGTYDLAMRLLDALYAHGTSPLIVLGHALPTHMPDVFLRRYPDAIVVAGWGEVAFTQIVGAVKSGRRDFDSIPNLMMWREEAVRATAMKSVTLVPAPNRVSPGSFFARVEASRGCQYDLCTFCTRPPRPAGAPAWFRRPPAEVLADVAALKASGITTFTFTDEDFVGEDLEGAMRIATGLKEMGGLHFSFSCRTSNVWSKDDCETTREQRTALFTTLRDAGLSLLFMGVESLVDSQLRRYGKGVTAADNLLAIDVIERLDISMELGFILFDPFLTIDELRTTVSTLSSTGHWARIGNLLDRLRVQRGAPIERLIRRTNLLTGFSPDLMESSYVFEHQWIGRAAETCIGWHNAAAGVYNAARNHVRSTAATIDMPFVAQYRRLAFDLLSAVVESHPDLDALPEIARACDERVRRLVVELRETLGRDCDLSIAAAADEYLSRPAA